MALGPDRDGGAYDVRADVVAEALVAVEAVGVGFRGAEQVGQALGLAGQFAGFVPLVVAAGLALMTRESISTTLSMRSARTISCEVMASSWSISTPYTIRCSSLWGVMIEVWRVGAITGGPGPPRV